MMIRETKEFETSVQYLPGVGPKTAKKLARLGVEKIGNLIYHFPRKYLDYSQIIMINELLTNPKSEFRNPNKIPNTKSQISNDSGVTVKGRIVEIGNKKTRRRGFTITEAIVDDGTGTLKIIWFNQPYLEKTLYAGREIILHGKVAWDHFNQCYSMESPDWAERPKIVPVYRETDGVTTHYLNRLISKVKDQMSKIDDFLPPEIIQRNQLLSLDQTIRTLHEPADMSELDRARERMAFDELFLISLRGQVLKQELKKDKAISLDAGNEAVPELIRSLPYELTGDQLKAWQEIGHDLQGEQPMNRLLNGDVGSGKTVVAALASYAAWQSGHSVALMAPTEILANQHFETFRGIMPADVNVELVTSSNKNQRSKIKDQKSGMGRLTRMAIDARPTVYIGTHALLYLEEIFDLALVIVDEQHRFGVNQRQALKNLSGNNQFSNDASIDHRDIAKSNENCKLKIEDCEKAVPHFLSMTATPIPRSLQLALFAELDVSIIREKPKDRREIKTRVVDESHRQKAYDFIRAHVKVGRQVFVVCPLIQETSDKIQDTNKSQNNNSWNSDESSKPTEGHGDNTAGNETLFEIDRKTVTGEYERLSKEIFPDLRIGMLHGKMKSKEKDAIMSQFSARELDILVSTSVVEVGVDIPNASVMMIEDAERFGLAQLHQFRGRVGRGEHQSFCFLFSNSESEKSLERLRKMEQSSDGFELAEFDLKTRGSGDIFGTDQSGFMDIKFADLSNAVLITQASNSAKDIVAESPNLAAYPLLKEKLEGFISSKHFE